MHMTMALDFDNGGAEVVLDKDGFPETDGDGRPPLPDVDLDPEKVNAITARALSDEPEDFTISGPPDGSAKLIAGYVDPSGNRWTTAQIRELRGRDEEALARALATGDMTRYIDTIVKVGVVSLGEIEDPKELTTALDELLVGDRDYLIMQIRRLAYGDDMKLDVQCPFCEEKFTVEYSFANDVPLRPFEQDDRSQRLFDVDLPSGSVAEMRLIDGKAQKRVFTTENIKKTDAELNTLLLREVTLSFDRKPIKGVGPILDMASKDRTHLLHWLQDNQPGPRYADVTQECPACVREFPLVVSLREMFRGI